MNTWFGKIRLALIQIDRSPIYIYSLIMKDCYGILLTISFMSRLIVIPPLLNGLNGYEPDNYVQIFHFVCFYWLERRSIYCRYHPRWIQSDLPYSNAQGVQNDHHRLSGQLRILAGALLYPIYLEYSCLFLSSVQCFSYFDAEGKSILQASNYYFPAVLHVMN